MEQVQCPHCKNFKVVTTEFKYDKEKKRRITNLGCMTSTVYILGSILGGLGLLLLFFDDVRMVGIFFLIFTGIMMLPSIFTDKSYKSKSPGYDYYCSACGFQWSVPDIPK
jgi:hypothetical protein